VVIPTLVLTACLDWTGSQINPIAYENISQLIGVGAWHLPAILLFLQMSWISSVSISPGSDGAYWSLGYEVIYYALFGFGFYCRKLLRIVGCVALGSIAGPHIIGLFPIWLLGWAAYHACGKTSVHPRLGWTAFVTSLGVMILWIVFANVSVDLAEHHVWEIVQDYGLAIAFAVNLVSFHAVSNSFAAFIRKVEKQIRWLAGATFTLYLLHLPVIFFIKATVPWPQDSWQFRTALIGLPLFVVFCVAQITERRKEGWRSAFDWIFNYVAVWARPTVRKY
jgi:peptidoglycan/LPS O-acetylase OafA/YrhL